MLVLVAILAVSHGGYAAPVWYPAALTALAILVIALLLAPRRRNERSRLAEMALGCYAVFCLFSLISALWADVPGQAWDSANRSALYGITFAIVAARPWSHRAAQNALLGIVLVVTAIAVGTLVDSANGDPTGLLLQGRLSAPFGYANATADFWLIGFWPAVWLACEPRLLWPLRSLALGAAGVLVQIALLSQSRGAVIAFGLTALLFVALVPRRWPALLMLGLCGGATALSWSKLSAVHDTHRLQDLGSALTDARRAIVVGAVALAAIGALWAPVDRALLGRGIYERVILARAGNRVLAVLAAMAVVGALVTIGNPVSWVHDRYQDFKTTGYTQVESGPNRFTGSLGSNRYDFYRVALDEFTAHPLVGGGAENFAVAYLRHRHSPENPQYPHSFAFGLLAGLGLLGALLIAGFVGLAVLAWRRGVATVPWPAAGVSVAALAGFAMFFLHGLADWLWQFPALGVLSFGLLGIAARTAVTGPRHLPPTPQERLAASARPVLRMSELLPRAAVAAALLLLAVSFSLPGISARLTDGAYKVSAADPALALNRLERAASLNFWRADPLLAKGLIAQAQGRVDEARSAFDRALAREPDNWYAFLELGILEAGRGDRATAVSDLQRAKSLNPGQPVIDSVRSAVMASRPVDPAEVNGQLNAQLADKLKPTG